MLFDLCATQESVVGPHGGAEYSKAVFRALLRRRPAREIAAFFDPMRELDRDIRELATDAGVTLIGIRNHRDLQELLNSARFTRMFSGLPYKYIGLDFSKVDLVMTIHGLREIEVPFDKFEWRTATSVRQFLSWAYRGCATKIYIRRVRERLRSLLNVPARSRTIVVPSLHTKYALLTEIPGLASSEIVVLYSPRSEVASMTAGDAGLLDQFGLGPKRYLLIVSANRWVKNAYRAIAAACSVLGDTPGWGEGRIVAVGGSCLRVPVQWNRFLTVLPAQPPATLACLYRHAYLLLYPSLNEGFGYPPIEAMAHGTPVIAAATSAIPEIAAAGAEYVCPTSLTDMKARLRWLLQDAEAYEQLCRRGAERAREIAAMQASMLESLCELLMR